MRVVVHLHDYDPDGSEIVHDAHCVHNPVSAADDRAVIDGVYVEWFPGGGNIHITDDTVDEVCELMEGSVVVFRDADGLNHKIENAGVVGVYRE